MNQNDERVDTSKPTRCGECHQRLSWDGERWQGHGSWCPMNPRPLRRRPVTRAQWDRAKGSGYTLGSPEQGDARMMVMEPDGGTALVYVEVVERVADLGAVNLRAVAVALCVGLAGLLAVLVAIGPDGPVTALQEPQGCHVVAAPADYATDAERAYLATLDYRGSSTGEWVDATGEAVAWSVQEDTTVWSSRACGSTVAARSLEVGP